MSKWIIQNEADDLTDIQVVNYIEDVIMAGKISTTKKGPQYCFVTRINDNYIVTCDKTDYGYKFIIYKEELNNG